MKKLVKNVIPETIKALCKNWEDSINVQPLTVEIVVSKFSGKFYKWKNRKNLFGMPGLVGSFGVREKITPRVKKIQLYSIVFTKN